MRRVLGIALAVAALGLVACGGSSGGGSSTTAPATTTSSAPSAAGAPSQTSPTAGTGDLPVVKQLVKNKTYKHPDLSIKADKETALVFANEDANVPHSMVIYNDSDFPLDTSAQVLFSFTPFPGKATNDYVIPPLEKGKYLFQCAVHPSMQGTIFVGIG